MTDADVRGGIEDHWDNAPCGHVIARPDGTIVLVNATMARWLGYGRDALRGRSILDLLTAGGRIHYETHFGPLLLVNGELNGVTVDLVAADGARLPMFLTGNVRTGDGDGPDLIRITAVDASDRRAYERELLHQRRRIEAEHGQVMAFAETLRKALLPPVLSPPDGLEAAGYYYAASAEEVGGDFYDLFPLSESTWGFFLGDVAGKGVDAAVVTGLIRYVLRSAAVSEGEPVRVLHNLNEVLGQELGLGSHRLCTLVYGNLIRRGAGFDVDLAGGGHPPPLVLAANGHTRYVDTTGGYAVGITSTPRFVSTRFHLGAGDTLMLYTDGLTEASTGRGRERFDDEGALMLFAREHAPATPDGIVRAVHRLLDELGAGVQDDAAVLAFGVPARVRLHA
ncbi:PP2C family protein-serine/threonine phosphatase [Mycolicibacterium sediminis]|uniref:PPM-type phosphatase domain-containing protein n=1 Tax=Mycolicibacterium sediminis TaxID=1286180 RepID=A0A7I7QZD4_9MYCO|nr:SpoIIE family protein phosphatase [Mycolicibacterium sediminis]BBY31698.1 hypothetical protein MSEDJ_57940 [Mycolicibacterium sediminis]